MAFVKFNESVISEISYIALGMYCMVSRLFSVETINGQ